MPAYAAKATETYDVDAAKMWAVMKNFAAPWLVELGPGTLQDCKGVDAGATRTVCFPGPDGSVAKWGERVSAYDEVGMSWSYVLTSPPPFDLKVETFMCTLSVKPVGVGTCEASIGCAYDTDAPETLPPMVVMHKSWIDKCFEVAKAAPVPAPAPTSTAVVTKRAQAAPSSASSRAAVETAQKDAMHSEWSLKEEVCSLHHPSCTVRPTLVCIHSVLPARLHAGAIRLQAGRQRRLGSSR